MENRFARAARAAAVSMTISFLMIGFIGCEQGPEKIITRTDTLTIHDTLTRNIHDTTIHVDTLYDTAKIPVGKVQPYMVFGVIEDGLANDSMIVRDSTYAYLSIFSNYAVKNAEIACGNHALSYTANQRLNSFLEASQFSIRTFPSAITSQYDAFFRDTAATIAWSVRLPFYSSDSGHALQFDTAADSVSFPGTLDTLKFFDKSGKQYSNDSIDFQNPFFQPKSIKLSEDLAIAWNDCKPVWYACEFQKYYYDPIYGYFAVGKPLDTMVTQPAMVLTNKFFYQDSLTPLMDLFSCIYLTVIPVDGPPPASWDSCPSFAGKGFLFALHADNPYMVITADLSLAKRALTKTAAARGQFVRPLNVEVLSRVLVKAKR